MSWVRRWAIIAALVVPTAAVCQEPVPSLPDPKHAGVRDLTPPEFLRPVEPVSLAEPSPGGIYASVEFLLLTPRQRGLDFALVDGQDDVVPVGFLQSLNNKTNPGVRARLGYRVPAVGWDVGFAYTFFQSSDNFTVVAPVTGLLYPTVTKPGLTDEAAIATANSRLRICIYDLEVGRTWCDESSQLRLFGGLRFASVRQGLSAYYDGLLADAAAVDVSPNFDGAGPLVGVESTWLVGHGFGLFGRGSGALLTGTMRAPFVETNNGGATVYADLRDRFALTVPVVSLGVGISYQYRGLFIRAGYEVTNWFGLFERPVFTDSFSEGKVLRYSTNLALDGLFVQFGLEF